MSTVSLLGALLAVSSCDFAETAEESGAPIGTAGRFLGLTNPGVREWEAVSIDASLVESGTLPARFSVEIGAQTTINGRSYTPVINHYLPVNNLPDTLYIRADGDLAFVLLKPTHSGLPEAREFLLYAFGAQELSWELPLLHPPAQASYQLFNSFAPEGAVGSSDSLKWTTWSAGQLGRSHSVVYEAFELDVGRTSIVHVAQAWGRTEWRLKQ